MQHLKIDIEAVGGEYCFGLITEPSEIQDLKNAIESGDEICDEIFSDNGEGSIYLWNRTLLYQIYGPEVPGSIITVTRCDDEDGYDETEDVLVDREDFDDTDARCICSSNPSMFNIDVTEVPKDSLYWGSQYTEKRIHFPAMVHLEDGVDFDISNIIVDTLNTDGTVLGSKIASEMYYVDKESQIKMLKDFLGDDYDGKNCAADYGLDFFKLGDKNPLLPFALEIGEIEGKGEHENNYAIVIDLDNKTLYEAGEY